MPQFRDNFHSEEAQEIMGRAPSWVVRWGITVIFVILALIVLGCYIIKYPQTVTAPISITTVNAPSDLTARYDGLLDSVCVGNGENVRTGQLIALLATPADYDDIRSLEEHLSATDSPQALAEAEWVSDRYVLGDLQSTWAEFAARCLDFRHYLATDLIGTKKRLLEAQIAKNKRYYAQLEAQGKLLATRTLLWGSGHWSGTRCCSLNRLFLRPIMKLPYRTISPNRTARPASMRH